MIIPISVVMAVVTIILAGKIKDDDDDDDDDDEQKEKLYKKTKFQGTEILTISFQMNSLDFLSFC